MNDVNTCTVSGRLIKPPELRRTPTGISVCDLYLLTSKILKNKKQTKTVIPITLWNKNAEYWGNKLNKSDHILVTGSLNQEKPNKEYDNPPSQLKMYNPSINLIKSDISTKKQNNRKLSIPSV